MTTREQIEALMAGTEGVTPGPWHVVIAASRGTYRIVEAVEPEADAALTDGIDGGSVTRLMRDHIARCSPEVIRDLCALALKALDAGSAPGVTVKPLEWRDGPVNCQAQGVGFLGYISAKDADGYRGAFWYGDSAFETLAQAKAAAQADYEQRILSALARPASPEVKPVAWRASINPFGQPGFRYAETEQELIRGGLHKREPLYANPPGGGLRDDRDSQQRVAIRLLSAVMAAQDVLAEWIVSGISDYECLNRLLSILDDQDFVRFERSLVNLRAALKGEPNAR